MILDLQILTIGEPQALKKQMFSIEQAQKETQKQLEELLRYRSKTLGMLMRGT